MLLWTVAGENGAGRFLLPEGDIEALMLTISHVFGAVKKKRARGLPQNPHNRIDSTGARRF